MDVKCQCGTVHFKTPTDKPNELYHCHCTECRKQSGSAFGTSAIFTSEGLIPLSKELSDKLGVWSRPTEQGGYMECYFCKVCGVRVMHRARDERGSERGVVSIKGGCIEGLDWEGGHHIYTSTAVMPIPEGAKQSEDAPE